VTILAALTLLIAIGDEGRLRVRIKEPARSESTISIDARLLILAEILPGDSLQDAWVEVRRTSGAEWHRHPISPARFVRLSEDRTLVAPILEPRRLPDVRSGETLWVRVATVSRSGVESTSWTLQIHVEEPAEREERLRSRLEQRHRELQDLLREFERDHRRLSRIALHSLDAEKLERPVLDELWSIDDAWASRLAKFQTLSKELSDDLDEAETDRLVDVRRADRYRRTIDRSLRTLGTEDGPLGRMRQDLARAAQAASAAERRIRFLALHDASDRFLDLLQHPEGELQVWRDRLDLKRILRSALSEQKDVTRTLDRERNR